MAKTIKRGIGDLGEEIACKYLENKGFSVIERNYLRPWGEIDIIATQNNEYHFVEVKSVTRVPGRVGDFRPEDNMHQKKLQRLHRAIQTYMLQHRIKDTVPLQIDLACVYIDKDSKVAKVDMLYNIM